MRHKLIISEEEKQKILIQWLKDSYGVDGFKPVPVGLSHYTVE